MDNRYTDIRLSDIVSYKDKISFLFVTATSIETKNLHERINANNSQKIFRIFKDNQTYYIGYFGKYLIVHVEASMGSIGAQSSIITTTNAITLWNPRAVIMPGIAFGADESKQAIGDILVSESIIPYDVKRVGAETVFRSPIPPSGIVLLNRFKAISKNWTGGNKIFFAGILSGESLVDDPEYKKELITAFPFAQGGEMEGVGIFTAANDKKKEWIVVKGICDYADGDKNKDKANRQSIAIKSSLSLCEHVLNTDNAFSDLGCKEVSFENQKFIIDQGKAADFNLVLFDIYSRKNEFYYFERAVDKRFNKLIDFYSLWLHGKSGNGKTSIIRRNLDFNNRKNHTISLGNCHDYSPNQILNYMLFEIETVQGHDLSSIPNFNETLIPKKLCSSLKIWLGNAPEGFIYLDEISITTEKQYDQFLHAIIGVLQEIKNNSSGLKIKIIISSIRSFSAANLSKGNQNISENLKFIEIKDWELDELNGLFEMISSELSLKFTTGQKEKIIQEANGSPRFIKNLIRMHMLFPEMSFDDLLHEVKRDHI